MCWVIAHGHTWNHVISSKHGRCWNCHKETFHPLTGATWHATCFLSLCLQHTFLLLHIFNRRLHAPFAKFSVSFSVWAPWLWERWMCDIMWGSQIENKNLNKRVILKRADYVIIGFLWAKSPWLRGVMLCRSLQSEVVILRLPSGNSAAHLFLSCSIRRLS